MIPILYNPGTSDFSTNGLGRLSDAISCVVTEERNGIYELEMEYPVDGIHFEELVEDRIIYCTPSENTSKQAFRIYKISKPLSGVVNIYAEHISYLLNKIPVMPYRASTCLEAFAGLGGHSAFSNNFIFWTDKDVTKPFKLDTPKPIRQVLGGETGSILDVYGPGDYEFDNFRVRFWANRGSNNGVTIRYGKNLTKLTSDTTIENSYVGIVPYWKKNETGESQTVVMTLPEYVVWAEDGHINDYAYRSAIPVDFSSEFDERPTEAELREKATTYLSNNKGWQVAKTIKVSFVALWQSEDYKDVAPLEKVRLCDIVTVVYPRLNINVAMKVVKTEYNVLLDRYNSIEIGESKTNLSTEIKVASHTDELTVQASIFQSEMLRATNMITGGLGGYVVPNYNANGQMEELLVMDANQKEDAVNVMRINQNGIGFSQNGYNGPFNSAWTIDGSFVADFITAGTLNAAMIKAGILQGTTGNTSFNLQTGELHIEGGEIYQEAYINSEYGTSWMRMTHKEITGGYTNYNGRATLNMSTTARTNVYGAGTVGAVHLDCFGGSIIISAGYDLWLSGKHIYISGDKDFDGYTYTGYDGFINNSDGAILYVKHGIITTSQTKRD